MLLFELAPLYIQVDVSSNQFNLEGGKTIRDAIEENSVTRMLDVRMCQMGEDVEVGPGVGMLLGIMLATSSGEIESRETRGLTKVYLMTRGKSSIIRHVIR